VTAGKISSEQHCALKYMIEQSLTGKHNLSLMEKSKPSIDARSSSMGFAGLRDELRITDEQMFNAR
jgi:hypothetical protein